MCILHLLPDLAVGGGQTVVLNAAREADESRFVVVVASVGARADLAEAFDAVGVETIMLGHEAGKSVRTLVRLVHVVRQLRPDVIHLHTGSDRLYGLVVAMLTGTPVVYHLHGRDVHLGHREAIGGSLHRRLLMPVLGPVSDALEHRVVRHYVATSTDIALRFAPLVSAPIRVLGQSMSLDRFEDRAEHRKATRSNLELDAAVTCLMNVSRLVDGKGHADLVDMLTRLLDWQVELVLIGEGDLRPVIVAQARKAGVLDRVHLLGTRHDVPDLLAAGDVFVFASKSEGFGLAVLEAMAAGLPVVAYRLPTLEDFVDDGHTGLLVPLGDVDALATATLELLQDPVRARRMGAAGRRVVAQRFPPGSTAHALEEVYQDVAVATSGSAKA